VSLVIAKAPPKKPTAGVPDVKGQSQTAATGTLQGAGFLVATKFKTVTDATRDGIVLGEHPSGGARAQKGSTVTITIGRYKPPPNTTTGTTTTTTTTTPGP
jgi:beta-lactam-binding protein with PASTA domain